MLRTLLRILVFLSLAVSVYGQKNFNITSSGGGGIKLGMSIAQAKRALGNCRFRRTSDGEGVALVGVVCRGKRVMTLYAGENSQYDPIDMKAKIEHVEFWDQRFKTNHGVHTGMLVSKVEKILGKVKEIVLTQIESREYVTFRKTEPRILYRIYGGIYPQGEAFTKRYEKGTKIWSIAVTKD